MIARSVVLYRYGPIYERGIESIFNSFFKSHLPGKTNRHVGLTHQVTTTGRPQLVSAGAHVMNSSGEEHDCIGPIDQSIIMNKVNGHV